MQYHYPLPTYNVEEVGEHCSLPTYNKPEEDGVQCTLYRYSVEEADMEEGDYYSGGGTMFTARLHY